MNDKRKIEEEIKFRELLKNPIRLFGWIYPYLFGLLLIAGIFYIKNLTDISFNEQAVVLVDTAATAKKPIEMKKGGLSPAVDLATIKNPTAEMIAKGKELFAANCKSCHGDNGMGDGPAGAALNPKPRNFHQKEGWTNGREFPQMYKTLQEGIIKNGMAAYEYLPASDRIDLISYIRTLTDFPPVTDKEVSDLDIAYNLSASKVLPNEIPVSLAEEKILEDRSTINDKLKNALERSRAENDPGAAIFSRYASNPSRAIYYFLNLGEGVTADKFLSALSVDAVDSGFKASVINLDRASIVLIYDYLRKITS